MPPAEKVTAWPTAADRDDGIHITETRHDKPSPYPFHRHAVHEFTLILEGRGRLRRDGASWPLARFDLIYLPPGAAHQLLDDEADILTRYTIFFRGEVLPPATRALLVPLAQAFRASGPLALSARPALHAVLDLFRRAANELSGKRPARLAALATHLSELVVSAARETQEIPRKRDRAADERLKALLPFFRQKIHQNIGLDEAAACVPLGRRQFSRVFRSVTGKSWLDWVHLERLARVDAGLASGMGVARAAFEAGFENLPHFHRLYKKIRGKTPRG